MTEAIDAEPGEAAGAPAGHDALYARAARALSSPSHGASALPEDARFIMRRGQGARFEDVRGRSYIDYVCGAGALVLGHAHPAVNAAMAGQVEKGIHFFAMLNEPSIELAEAIVDAAPSAERVVFATTGSEATFYAMRLARAFTGRDKVLKFEGGYHGNHDYSNFSVHAKALTNYPEGLVESAGIPGALSPTVLVAPYNDLEATRRIALEHRRDLAAIVVEPIQRIITSGPGFLAGLRSLADEIGALLVFDEVVTGFRLAYGGGQEYFGVTPDLAAYGKIVGGGAALSAVAGKGEIVAQSAPAAKGKPGYAMVNGTLHGNPLAAAAGLATLAELRKPGAYRALADKGDQVRKACQRVLDRRRVTARAVGQQSLWQILFLDREPRTYADFLASDLEKSKALDLELVRQGVYVLPNLRRFVSLAHTDQDIEDTAKALDAACRKLN
jgi:glutamate-1-semialdehyde 2,1-aminomutase